MSLDLSILIVNWNAGNALRSCLQSILKCKTRHKIEVIVVDNNSSDESPEMVQREFPRVKLLKSGGNLGFARANNLARSIISSERVFFLNPDSVLHSGAIDAMVSVFEKAPEIGAVGCKMRYADGTVWQQLVQRFPSPWLEFLGILIASSRGRAHLRGLFPYLDPDRSSYASKLCGGCLMVRRRVLDEVGWFDERYFMYGEDADLSRSIADHGWKLFYVSEAEVSHAGGESSRRAPSEFPILMHCESMAKLMNKYYGRLGVFNYRLAIFVASLIRLASLLPIGALRWCVPPLRRFQMFHALHKYRLMFQWSLGLRRPAIPGSSS
jgi:O-antigen biosynthesis protein